MTRIEDKKCLDCESCVVCEAHEPETAVALDDLDREATRHTQQENDMRKEPCRYCGSDMHADHPTNQTLTPQKDSVNYNHISHTHCWAQKQPSACGIPLDTHTQCCLCDLAAPQKDIEGWEKEFDEQFVIRARRGIAAGIPQIRTVRAERIKSFISSLLKQERERVERVIDGMVRDYQSFEKETPYYSINENMRRHESHNAALTDLKAKLKNE